MASAVTWLGNGIRVRFRFDTCTFDFNPSCEQRRYQIRLTLKPTKIVVPSILVGAKGVFVGALSVAKVSLWCPDLKTDAKDS